MTQEELQELVEAISLKYFDRPFTHYVKINQRMTTTGGRYHMRDHHLEFNAHFLVPERRQALIGIIKHELVHYHLDLAGKDCCHRSRAFKALLVQVGGSRYTPDIGLKRTQTAKYCYICTRCGSRYRRKRQINIRRYLCGKCGGRLKRQAS